MIVAALVVVRSVAAAVLYRLPLSEDLKSSELDKAGLVKLALHQVKNLVKELRNARGFSQAELGAAMSVSRQTINSIETERYTPSLPLALALARFFDKTVEEVFDDEAA